MMPVFWGTVGPVIYGEYWLHICDDRDDCAVRNPMRVSCVNIMTLLNIPLQSHVPSCEACVARVTGAVDAMVWENTITAIVAWMSYYCGQFSTHVPGEREQNIE